MNTDLDLFLRDKNISYNYFFVLTLTKNNGKIKLYCYILVLAAVFFSIWIIIFVLFLPFASYWVLKVISVIFINKWRPIECLRYLILPKIQNKKCLKRSERVNLYIKVADQLFTPFIKLAFILFSKYVLLLSRTRDFPWKPSQQF